MVEYLNGLDIGVIAFVTGIIIGTLNAAFAVFIIWVVRKHWGKDAVENYYLSDSDRGIGYAPKEITKPMEIENRVIQD